MLRLKKGNILLMKSIRMIAVNQPLELHEVPIPIPADNQVLVQIRAAGICHSDAHYRAGVSPVYPLPLTLGHEIAGLVVETGRSVTTLKPGDRVCLHYLLTCGECQFCIRAAEQFCRNGRMLGHHADGGFAEYIAVPERNAVSLPDEIPFEQGATLMCASATAFHALRKSRLVGGERVAIFGVGGLGLSAVQLAFALGALEVYAVDINPAKLGLASRYGAHPIYVQPDLPDPAEQIRQLTQGYGVDVALELIGLPQTMQQALRSLAVFGRAVIAGISSRPLQINTYQHLLGPEAELIGSNDHLLSELPLLIDLARRGKLDLSYAVSQILDNLQAFGSEGIRTVIVPG
jgi:propanol-preferring alcohol dehydrogenase